MKTLVTGAAGFIGMHSALRLLQRGDTVVGIDDLNAYYSPRLKQDRLAQLTSRPGFRFERLDVADVPALGALFEREGFDRVLHLAAQAGVRHSIDHALDYGHSNLSGFLNLIERCRDARVRHLVYASSSSVYGDNRKLPFAEGDRVDTPLNLYAATKRANELMAQAYCHLYRLPATGLRLFTAYGPWGRPDMAYWLFTQAILEGRPIDVFAGGQMSRDFTYIDDVVDAIVGVLDRPPEASPARTPHRLLNIGNQRPEPLAALIECIERATGCTAQRRMRPMQDSDVADTCADVQQLAALTGATPHTPLAEGIERFVAWYRGWHSEDRPAAAPMP
jgi:UDP-glucuronate 4-epimerase